jgi:2-dehydro-3-deoxy-D-arabinonate dehydratase
MTATRVVAFRGRDGRRHLAAVDHLGRGFDLGPGELHELIERARLAGQWPAELVAEVLEVAPAGSSVVLDEILARVGQPGHDRIPGAAGEMALESPVAAPEVWAAGVTYRRSREAREAETAASTKDIYSRVYEAERPELFLKDAGGRRTVPSGGTIRVRTDSAWSVPEPELALVLDATGRIVGYTAANDVSARDIEGANPLYLPQAKVYFGSFALGPAVLMADGEAMPSFAIGLRVIGPDGRTAFEGTTNTSSMARSFDDLVRALLRDNVIGDGTVLSTGTGVVPPETFTLAAGQRVEIRIGGIGTLWNMVEQGRSR